MDIFVRNVPPLCTEAQVRSHFKPILNKAGISVFHCHKIRKKPLAILTVLSKHLGEAFLEIYKQGSSSHGRFAPYRFMGQIPRPEVSKYASDPYKLRALEHEVKEHEERQQKKKKKAQQHGTANHVEKASLKRAFEITSINCGYWTYERNKSVYCPVYTDKTPGTLVFDYSSASCLLAKTADSIERRVEFDFFAIDSIIIGQYECPTVSLVLYNAPRFFEIQKVEKFDGKKFITEDIRSRVQGLHDEHLSCVASCFVYQFMLDEFTDSGRIFTLLRSQNGTPSFMSHRTVFRPPDQWFEDTVDYTYVFDYTAYHEELDFSILFQIQRVVSNNQLSPGQIVGLFPTIRRLCERHGNLATAEGLRKLAMNLEFPGPSVDGSQFHIDRLSEALEDAAESFSFHNSKFKLVSLYKHLVMVHRAHVTPAGIYLASPEPEVSNRVLRKYEGHSDHFMRVSFMDEDGESMRLDWGTSLGEIYHGRYKKVLLEGFKVAGRRFKFLGFSHSSLRTHTTWFMAPFFHQGVRLDAEDVIKDLGDFSSIRSPSRMAARIGQAFTDTTGSVILTRGQLVKIPDVERNSRVFSDGCGTISQSLLEKVWREYPLRKGVKPTTIQIRLAGAKGIVSLDTRLRDDMLCVRNSMTKFSSKDMEIEICGGAFRPLPFYLNRQFIKIFEDLGVPEKVFIDMQADAVAQLRQVMEHPVNAAHFLDIYRLGTSVKLPQLLRMLNQIGISFQEDDFLRHCVEIAALSRLREIKHRQRIIVEDGATLFGIMDETGTLKEGEVHVIIDLRQGGRRVLEGGRVVVTRAPALHPGDIQVVRAVGIPEGSPLNSLRNCIIFSQHGERDLPSQLSGGDLDGDLFQVTWNHRLMPKRRYMAADYPRVPPREIDGSVMMSDMSDFFIHFMEADQLGRISTMHMQIADKRPSGTIDPDCVELAGLASTAVDFSKTGIAVDMSLAPRTDNIRPDFMAPGPRILMSSKILTLEEHEQDAMEEKETIDAQMAELGISHTTQRPRHRFYPSQKVLGKLYRAIDEHEFLSSMHSRATDAVKQLRSGTNRPRDSLPKRVWTYLSTSAALVRYSHHLEAASDIHDMYNEHLLDCLTWPDLDQRSNSGSYSAYPSLTEAEVYVGSVLGRSQGAQNKRQREASTAMSEAYDRAVNFAISRVIHEVPAAERLPRAMACLKVAMDADACAEKQAARDTSRGGGAFSGGGGGGGGGRGGIGHWKNGDGEGRLRSWTYVAVALCLEQVELFMGNLLHVGAGAGMESLGLRMGGMSLS